MGHLHSTWPGSSQDSVLRSGTKAVCLARGLRTYTMTTASLGYARRGGWAGISVTARGSKVSGQKTISYSGFLSELESRA